MDHGSYCYQWISIASLIALLMVISSEASCRHLGKCCPGRDSSCNSSSISKTCYCDEFCTKSGDCCRDYDHYCRKQDCVMTYWTHWGECSGHCGKGRQSRTRGVHIPAARGGQPCGRVKQTRGCHDEGVLCRKKEIASLLPTYYKSYRHKPNIYTDEVRKEREGYCIKYYLTYVSPFCARDTPWFVMKAGDKICVECEDVAMDKEGRCRGSLPHTSDTWAGIATKNCFGMWRPEGGIVRGCECGGNHGYDFLFV